MAPRLETLARDSSRVYVIAEASDPWLQELEATRLWTGNAVITGRAPGHTPTRTLIDLAGILGEEVLAGALDSAFDKG